MRKFELYPNDPQPLPWGWQILFVLAAAAVAWLLYDIPQILEDLERWVG